MKKKLQGAVLGKNADKLKKTVEAIKHANDPEEFKKKIQTTVEGTSHDSLHKANQVFSEIRKQVENGEVSWDNLKNIQQRKLNDVIRVWRDEAAKGHSISFLSLGEVYEHGLGVEQSFQNAAEWYHQGAEKGMGEAQLRLGMLYSAGKGVAEDQEMAIHWIRQAAEQGHEKAKIEFDHRMRHAMATWLRLAEQGDKMAQFSLGRVYERGQNGAVDFVKSADYYRKSANQGVANAQHRLGCLYLHGKGVVQDNEEAMKLFQLAAAQGHKEAEKRLREQTEKIIQRKIESN